MIAEKNGSLEALEIRTPCPASWDAMKGNDQVRFCSQCRLNVYNISEMSRKEAEALVAGTEGRLCVQFYRGPDGTVLTRDCSGPRLARARRRLAVAAGVAALMFGQAVALVSGSTRGPGGAEGIVPRIDVDGMSRRARQSLSSLPLVGRFISPPPSYPLMGAVAVLGDVAIAPAPAPIMGKVALGEIAAPYTHPAPDTPPVTAIPVEPAVTEAPVDSACRIEMGEAVFAGATE